MISALCSLLPPPLPESRFTFEYFETKETIFLGIVALALNSDKSDIFSPPVLLVGDEWFSIGHLRNSREPQLLSLFSARQPRPQLVGLRIAFDILLWISSIAVFYVYILNFSAIPKPNTGRNHRVCVCVCRSLGFYHHGYNPA